MTSDQYGMSTAEAMVHMTQLPREPRPGPTEEELQEMYLRSLPALNPLEVDEHHSPPRFFVVLCKECADAEVPFSTPEGRAEWVQAHRGGTGHNQFQLWTA